MHGLDLVVVVVVALVAHNHVSLFICRLDLLLKFEDMEHVPMDQDNIGNNGTEVESRAFLRSRSMPGP